MAWWRRSTSGISDGGGASFRWTPEMVATFLKGFHEMHGVVRNDLVIHVTHQCVEQTSRNLRTEDRYFGWFALFAQWRGQFGVRLPIQLLLVARPEKPYEDREPHWPELSSLGEAYLWKRGGDSDRATHGIEATLFLDSERYGALRDALRLHRGPAPPTLTLALHNPATTPTSDSSIREDQSSVAAHDPFPVLAYWLTTLPLAYGDGSGHPWVADIVGE